MKTILKLLLGFVLALNCTMAQAQTTLLANGTVVNSILDTTPTRDVTAITNGYEVTYTFPGWNLLQDPLYPTQTMVKINGFGYNETEGEPAYPYLYDTFAVPTGKIATVVLTGSAYMSFNLTMAPARPPLLENSTESYSTSNVPNVNPFLGFSPRSPFEKESDCNSYRGVKLQRIGIFPVQYIYSNNTVRLAISLSYRITFEDDGLDSVGNVTLDTDDTFLRNITLNDFDAETITELSATEDILDSSASDDFSLSTLTDQFETIGQMGRTTRRSYLIVTTPEFSEVAESFKNWKQTMGVDTRIYYPNGQTPETIKSEIDSLYRNNSKLYYLLIIGDNTKIPVFSFSFSYRGRNYPYATDFFYSSIDGDRVPDLYMGRIPASNSNAAEVVINKIIAYEKNPPTSSSFYENAIHCSYFQADSAGQYDERRFVHTSEDIRDCVMTVGKNVERIYTASTSSNPKYWAKENYDYGEEIPEELQRPNFQWDGDATDIISAINNGVFYVLHRDHGMINSWSHPYFSTQNISTLTNGNLTPVIFGLECQAGDFTTTTGFSRKFLEHPNGGCVGVISPTQISFSKNNDILACGMFDAIWPVPGVSPQLPYASSNNATTHSPVHEMGAILQQGVERMKTTSKATSTLNYQQEIYHYLGDPSMRILTQRPNTIRAQVERNTVGLKFTIPNPEIGMVLTIFDPIQDKIVYSGKFLTSTPVNMTSYMAIDNPQYVIVSLKKSNYRPFVDYGMSSTASAINPLESRITYCTQSPSGHSLNIGYSVNIREGSNCGIIMISDIMGNTISKKELENLGSGEINLDTSRKGFYIVNLLLDNEIKDTKRVIVK